MFVRKLRVKKAHQQYEYLKVVENVREHGKISQKTLVNLGNVSHWSPAKLEQLITLLAAFIEMPIGTPPATSLDDIQVSAPKLLGPFLALDPLWKQLDMDRILAASLPAAHDPRLAACIKALVFTQLISPRSKLSAHTYVAQHAEMPGIAGDALPLQCYYRALTALAAAQKAIEHAVHERLRDLFNRDVSLVFYDLTSSYFEGTHCAKAQYGYSRDHRPDLVQIEIGLLVDNRGVPIGHDVFEGNIKDVSTVLNALERLQHEFSITRCVFVGDDGMASEHNLAQVAACGYEYITSLSLGKSSRGQQLLAAAPPRAHWHDLKDLACRIHVFPEVADSPGITHVGTYNAARAASTRDKRARRLRTCLKFAQEINGASSRRISANTAEKRLRRVDRFFRQKHCTEFFTLSLTSENQVCCVLKREALRQARRADGVLILQSNSTTLTAEDITRGYRSLWMVENAFRHLKDPLQMRPIRHWSDPRVLGHIFICVLAFTLERLYELALETHHLPYTARKAFEELSDIVTVLLEANGKSVRKRSKISAEQRKLLSAVGVKEVAEIW